MVRTPIPVDLQRKVLYDSAYVCAICQAPAVQLHHIDDDPSNNIEDNLICLCANHHGEAHTVRKLGKNLTPAALKDAREKWTEEVKERRAAAASVAGQLERAGPSSIFAVGTTWGYINHDRVVRMVDVKALDPETAGRLADYVRLGIVDVDGIPIWPSGSEPSDSYITNSIYDKFEHGNGLRLHALYDRFVDHVSQQTRPIHLEARWITAERVEGLVQAGSIVFIQAAFYFKPVSETAENEHRFVHTTVKDVKVEFYVDTYDMFGTTSMTVSFSGRQTCAALLQVKSLNKKDGKLILVCTPIALGVAFQKIS